MKVERSSGNVFADVGLPHPEQLLADSRRSVQIEAMGEIMSLLFQVDAVRGKHVAQFLNTLWVAKAEVERGHFISAAEIIEEADKFITK